MELFASSAATVPVPQPTATATAGRLCICIFLCYPCQTANMNLVELFHKLKVFADFNLDGLAHMGNVIKLIHSGWLRPL